MNQPTAQPDRAPNISICIITYKRTEQLITLLDSMARQVLPAGVSFETIVVDNDASASARAMVQQFRAAHPDMEVVYDVESSQGIPLARNRSVRMSRGDFIAFIDDDEWAAPQWLAAHWKGMHSCNVEALIGPVVPVLPDSAPQWIKKGNFFDRPKHTDGAIVIHGYTGNALVNSSWLKRSEYPFDPGLRLTGGSDSDFFSRIQTAGATLRWTEGAVVYETIGEERLCLRWLLMRAFRGGQGFAWRHAINRPIGFRIRHCLFRSALAGVSLILSLAVLPFGRSRSVWWLRKLFGCVGQLSAYLPFRYEEYRSENYR